MEEQKKRKEILSLLILSLNEMEKNQCIILTRGDLIMESDRDLYGKAYQQLMDLLKKFDTFSDVKEIVRYKNTEIFFKNESFFMDLFETRKFPAMFDLFEFE